MDLNSLSMWATAISGYLFVFLTFGAGLRWAFKHYLHELKHNGGNSIKDAVDDIRENVHQIKLELSRLEGRFEQHVDEGD